MLESTGNDQPTASETTSGDVSSMSKSAKKRFLKQQRLEARKVERKAAAKERRRQDLERRRREWEDKLSGVSDGERAWLVESRKEERRERMERKTEERGKRAERLRGAAEVGQNVVLDLDFSDLMKPGEIQSLAHQIMYCYAVNGKCEYPVHLWLTGCKGNIGAQLQRLPGFDKWIIEKDDRSYIETFQDQKEKLVYLTADAETTLEEIDTNNIYIIGGLVDRNRWKGITMKKAIEHGIRSARLPIGNYIKLASSQVLTVNQVVEILLKFLETRDWKNAFFSVIPQRKRHPIENAGKNTIDQTGADTNEEEEEEEDVGDLNRRKKQRAEAKAEESEVMKVLQLFNEANSSTETLGAETGKQVDLC